MAIQYLDLGVMVLGMKPVITPTKNWFIKAKNCCDIARRKGEPITMRFPLLHLRIESGFIGTLRHFLGKVLNEESNDAPTCDTVCKSLQIYFPDRVPQRPKLGG